MPRRPLIALALLAATVWSGANAGALPQLSLPSRENQPLQPINLEAASSQFDGQAELLSFQDVRITQGPMSVQAQLGRVARLDFENSLWRFEGEVVLDNEGAHIKCESAELTFQGHELRSALFHGTPARFRQERPAAAPTEGKAGVMEYDVAASFIRLSGAAWISDGANEVSGERMVYDLSRHYVTADSDGNGAVHMKIQPPEKGKNRPSP